VAEERSKIPKSVWEKKVAWAIQHHCYFFGMSRDEIVHVLGQPTEEESYALTYKRQTRDCARYNGDICADYKTDQSIIFLQDGYTDPKLNDSTNGCRTLSGEHEYLGLDVPNFRLAKAATKSAIGNEANDSEHERFCKNLHAMCLKDPDWNTSTNCSAFNVQCQ